MTLLRVRSPGAAEQVSEGLLRAQAVSWDFGVRKAQPASEDLIAAHSCGCWLASVPCWLLAGSSSSLQQRLSNAAHNIIACFS